MELVEYVLTTNLYLFPSAELYSSFSNGDHMVFNSLQAMVKLVGSIRSSRC